MDEREVETRRELKKLKTDSKAATSLQFKGNRFQFEFNTQLLDCLDLAISNPSEGNLLAVQEHLQKAKSNLEKHIKLIRFADKSPACWAAVEEYESDELAENSGKGPCNAHGVTYEIECQGCGNKYVGETARNAYTRGTEHAGGLENRDEKSALWKHCVENIGRNDKSSKCP